jgi:hypothetical protein
VFQSVPHLFRLFQLLTSLDSLSNLVTCSPRFWILTFKVNWPRCLSSPQITQSAPSVANLCMQQKSVWLVDTNGTKLASNAACAIKCWTPRTARSTRESCSAKSATEGSSDPRVTVSVVGLDVSPWTLASSSQTRRGAAKIDAQN